MNFSGSLTQLTFERFSTTSATSQWSLREVCIVLVLRGLKTSNLEESKVERLLIKKKLTVVNNRLRHPSVEPDRSEWS